MEKEILVLSAVAEILKDADKEISAVFKKHMTEGEIDGSTWALMAHSLAWDAMREAEVLKNKAETGEV